jgi:hypothetical protein
MSTRSPLGSATVTQFPTQRKGLSNNHVSPGFLLMETMVSLLLDQLPSSTGTVSGPDAKGIFDVTVSWADRNGSEDSTCSVSFEIKPLN